jgi:calcium-dependent protein kinase
LFPIDADVPYKAYKELIANPAYVEKQLKRIKDTVSADAFDLLSRMLRTDPKERISAKEALVHPFLRRFFSDTDASNIPEEVAQVFDLDIVYKMEEFARQPQLKRAGMIALAHLIGTEDEESRLQRATFCQLDKLGLGTLSLADFVAGCEEHGVDVPEGFGERVFPLMDLNTSEDLNFNEFLAATIEVKAGKHDKAIMGVFQMLDQNGSGVLDVRGFQELFPQSSANSLEAMVHEAAPNGQVTYEGFYHLMTSSDGSAGLATGQYDLPAWAWYSSFTKDAMTRRGNASPDKAMH